MFRLLICLFLSFFYLNGFSQTVSFTYTGSNGNTNLCSPAVINFKANSTGTLVGYTWYFGNGQTSNSAIPSITFTAGTYNVKLVAVFNNSALETTQTIVVNPGVTANFTANRSYICKPDTVSFNCLTVAPNATFQYGFGDGSPLVVSKSSYITHSFTNFGTFNTSVKVTNTFGCTYSGNSLVQVKLPLINSTVTPINGCAPANVTFDGTTVDVPLGSKVINYAWSFGDGSATSNTTSSGTTHLYSTAGNFNPVLTITTKEGCTNTFTYPSIFFGLAPSILEASPNKSIYCGNEIAKFSVKSDFASKYKWEYGDGAQEFLNDETASHKYSSLGIKKVTVTPINNDCAGQPYSFTINIIGVIALYNYANSCTAKNKFNFTNTSLGNQSFKEWTFGDSSASVFTTNATHTFPISGAFNSRLIIADDSTGCRDTVGYTIFTANPTLLNPDTFLCKKSSTKFSVSNNYSNTNLTYSWSALGLQNIISPPPYFIRADSFGNFNRNYVVLGNGPQYCPDTIRLNKSVRIGGPKISYITDSTSCAKNDFIITNTSKPYLASDTIKKWAWTFGIPGLSDTAYQPAPFVYPAEGGYSITLIAKDKNACIDTLIKNVVVKESPFLRIFPRTAQICAGQTITLTGYHTDTLKWAPASMVTCATCDTTFTTPVNSTKIYAIATNENCSLKDSSIITVFPKFTAVVTPNLVATCINNKETLSVSPSNKKIVWSPGFGLSNSTIYNPVVTVIADTSYLVTLTDSAGCYSSEAVVKIRAYPLPSVNSGPDRLLAYNSPFTISPVYSSDVTSYLWSPSNKLDCSNCPQPSGFADSTRSFIVTVSTTNKCIAKDTVKISITCAYANLFMASAFSPNNISIKKYYYPQTVGIKMINRFVVFNRFGEPVYEIKNALPNTRSNGWDGKYKGIDQVSGGYVYMLDATCEKGETLNKKGSFLLVR